MGNRNINSTSYVHNDEPNTNDVTKAMEYNALGKPVLRIADSLNQPLTVASGASHYIPVFKAGYNPTFANGTQESYWGASVAYPWSAWDTPGTVSLVSTSTADTASVTVYGLDENFAQQTVVYPMTGTVAVTTTEQWARIHHMVYNSSPIPNAGNVTATIDSTVVAFIKLGEDASQMAQYTVPAGFTGYVMQGTANIGKGNDGAGSFRTRLFGSGFQVAMYFQLYQSTFNYVFTTPMKLPEKTDLDVVMTASNANTTSSVIYELILIENV